MCHRQQLKPRKSNRDVGHMALRDVQGPKVLTRADDPAELLIRHRHHTCQAKAGQASRLDAGIAQQPAVDDLQALQPRARGEEGLRHLVRAPAQAQHVQTRLRQAAPVAGLAASGVLLGDDAQPPDPEAAEEPPDVLRAHLELEHEAAARASWQRQVLQQGLELGRTSQQALEVPEPRVPPDPRIQVLDLAAVVARPGAARVVVVEGQALVLDLVPELLADAPQGVEVHIHLSRPAVPQEVADQVKEHVRPYGGRQIEQ
mmetsp:Transcript_15023/g.44493  ORF Transcript_15023/g.44493 Transcript_15023/m.44493 type:complete len:259 (-) Transcript_15023:130-906(-)